MNRRQTYLAASLVLLFSSVSYAEPECANNPPIEAKITLSQDVLANSGGYISSQLKITNDSCEPINFKYWLSIKGAQGLYFPAKAVVGVDGSQLESSEMDAGRVLNVTRGFWIPQYMADGKYTVSLQVVTESGQVFKTDKDFVKGVALNSLPELDGLTVDIQNQFNINSVESAGGFVPFNILLTNNRPQSATVEFWMTAVGPNGLIIPVHAREKWTIAANTNYPKVRGFTFDESYPEGEYTINTQVVDTVSGKRVEQLLTVIKN